MILIPAIALGASFAFYLWFLWTVWRGLGHLSKPAVASPLFVSVIIAARNEDSTIERCLESLLDQDYPLDAYEIIVVDDHSTDTTFDIVTSMTNARPTGKISAISLRGGAASGKPQAISRGIQNARGEIILCTDADCVAPRQWIRSMMACFEPSVAFVAGPVLELPSSSIFSRLQSLEFLGLITTAAGLIGTGTPIICNGANVAYRKSAFLHVSGYGGQDSSCDDETLMQRIVTRNIGRVVFNGDPEATVVTSSPNSFREFWHQRTRWAAKRGRYENAMILFRLVLLYSFFAIALLSAVFALSEPALWTLIVPVFLLKTVGDLLVLQRGAKMLRQRISLLYFVIAELFHVPYIALAGLISQFASIRWKGRTLEK
jgi:cellulose synthase/poly-beta-1,6-N-acetylglucosamine synthase-like glycosyltransferase